MASHGASVEPASIREEIPPPNARTNTLSRLPTKQSTQQQHKTPLLPQDAPAPGSWIRGGAEAGRISMSGMARASLVTIKSGREPSAGSGLPIAARSIPGGLSQAHSKSSFSRPLETGFDSVGATVIHAIPVPANGASKTNTLRRKPSLISTYVSQSRGTAGIHSSPGELTPLGSLKPPLSASSSVTEFEDADTPENLHFGTLPLDPPYADAPQPPTSAPPPSITPSTRYSESPGAFSLVATPNSMSSFSSHITSSPGTKSSVFGMSPGEVTAPTRYPASAMTGLSRSLPQGDPARYQSRKIANGSNAYANMRTESPTEMKTTQAAQGSYRSVPSTYPPSKLKSSNSVPDSQWPITTNTKIQNPLIYLPPELAHLMESSGTGQGSSEQVPSRPSRDGTSDLDEQQRTSPVIYSKLPALHSPFHEQRQRPSMDGSDTGSVASGRGDQIQLPARSHTQPPPQAQGPSPVTSPAPRSVLRKPKPVVLESHNKPASRFGFFSRKQKPEAEAADDDITKTGKKGPMAGTGHEGYGKYAARRRSAGFAGAIAALPPTSSPASASVPEGERKSVSSSKSDPGAGKASLDKSQPTCVRGDGTVVDGHVIPNHVSSSGSSHNTLDGQSQPGSSIGSPKTFRTSNSSTYTQARSSGLSTIPRISDVKSPPRTPSAENSDSDASQKGSRLPARKGFFGSRTAARPVQQRTISAFSSTTDSSTSHATEPEKSNLQALGISLPHSEPEEPITAKKSGWSLFPKSSSSPKKTHPWTMFQRSQSPMKPTPEAVPVAVAPDLNSKSIAHYALLDSQDQISIEDLDDIMREADALQRDEDLSHTNSFPTAGLQYSPALTDGSEHMLSPHNLTSPALITPDSSASSYTESPALPHTSADRGFDEANELHGGDSIGDSTPRPSRLAQVGRIPKVVSKRDRTRTLPDVSFSRPFVRAQPMPNLSKRESTGAALDTHEAFSFTQSVEPIATPDDSLIQQSSQSQSLSGVQQEDSMPEFISFPARKNSDLSYSSSSGTVYVPTSRGIISDTGTPLSEDEIWQEYDDLLDDILTPSTSNTVASLRPQPLFASPSCEEDTGTDTQDTPKAGVPSASLTPNSLRRSRLLAVLQPPSPLATTKPSFPGGNGINSDDQMSGSPHKRRSSLPRSFRNSTGTSGSSRSSELRASLNFRYSSLAPLNEADDQDSPQQTKLVRSSLSESRQSRPESSANLRFAALMVSKWLSFGRVLFSPAHSEAIKVSSERILVVDGLGKDWSYWCALTYSNAEVYNLGPPPVETASKREIQGFKSLTNHRYISHAEPTAPFPFPKAFFAAVIFRFPSVSSEAKYRNTITECKRVLRPGGFIEISMLDLDLNNMGNRGRRAVRSLKTRLQQADPDVSLQPPDDIMIRLLGHRGFENLNRCVVGLPAAGAVSGSRDNSVDKDKKNLAELVKDESTEGDDGITKSVAKVGRWWYTRSFEKSLLPNGDYSHSIWSDTALLRECEVKQTSLKLLICYAQKPLINKRRTVSI